MPEVSLDRNRRLKLIGIVLVVGVLAFVVWSTVPSIVLFGVFDHVVDGIVEATGWSRRLVRGLVTVAMIPFAWAVMHVLSLRLIERAKAIGGNQAARRRTRLAQLVITVYLASYFFVMYLAYRETRFITVDGKTVAVQRFALTPEGCEFFEEPGVHRKYGIRLEPVTPEIIVKCDQVSRKDAPRPIVVKTIEDIQFFDPIRGTPLVYYYERPDGRVDLFSRPGVHPIYGGQLRAADTRIVDKVRAQLASDQELEINRQQQVAKADAERLTATRQAEIDQRRLRYLPPSTGGPQRAALAVSSGHSDAELSARLAQAVSGSTGILSAAFVTDGLYADAMSGDYSRLRAVQMERALALLLLAEVRSHGESSIVAGETVFKGTAQIRVVVVRPAEGYSANSFEAQETGGGYSIEAAQRSAIEKATGVVVSRLAQYR